MQKTIAIAVTKAIADRIIPMVDIIRSLLFTILLSLLFFKLIIPRTIPAIAGIQETKKQQAVRKLIAPQIKEARAAGLKLLLGFF